MELLTIAAAGVTGKGVSNAGRAIALAVLRKVAFPLLQEAPHKRANAIRRNIEESEKQRQEAEKLLEEYRHRLTEAREQAEDIVARARKAAEAAQAEAVAAGKEKR